MIWPDAKPSDEAITAIKSDMGSIYFFPDD